MPAAQAAAQAASQLASGVAMHIAGMRPLYLDRTAVPETVLQHERDVLKAQAVESKGKPEGVITKVRPST